MTRGILLGIAYNNRVNEIEVKYKIQSTKC